ncbi:MAG: putative Ig domain-containing protein, partial [Gammaproteobacteria bacterium]|nr:putative Ig domain-containing protein [Gammaproteobacteria bacterium]
SVSGNPAWLSIHPTTGELSGTPSNGDVGTSSGIVVSVTDGTATTSLPAFDLTVTNVNDAPTIAGTPPPTVPEGSPYSFSPTASDVDTGDALAFSISGHPAWLSIDEANGELSGTPSASDIGVTSGIVVTVTDLTDASASLSPFSIEVTDVNVAPVLRGTLSDESTNEDSQYRREIDVTAVFEDADANDTLTLSLGEASPGWLSFDGNALVGTPTDAEVGEHTVTVVATDGQGASVETDFNLTVVNTDDPATGLPSISGEPVVGQTLVADVSAINDEDGIQSITYRWMRGETLVGSDAQYALGSEDVGAAIALTVIVTDQFGQVMALSSAQLGPVADNNPVLNLISTGLTEAGLASLGILEITGDNLQAYKAFVEAMVPLPTTIQQLQSAIDLVNTAEAVAAEVVDGQSQLAIEANASSLGMNVGNVAAIAAIVDSKLAAGETISTDMLVEASNQVESQLVRLISASVSSASVADAAPLASELENAMGLARVKQGNSMLYAKMLEQNAPTSMADVQSVVDAAALAIESLQQQAHSMERDAATLTAAMAALGLSDIDPTAHSAVMNALLEEGSFESYETLQAKVEAAATKALEHPVLWIDLTQGEEHLVVDSALVGAGLITAHAEIGNPNQNEVRYDWGGSDAQVLAAMVDADDQQQLVIDSDLLAPGQYRLHVKVERNGLLAESVFLLDVDPVGSVASVDRDGDGVLDQYENGLDGADNPLHLNKLQIQRAQGDRFVLQADAGVALKLGQLARAGKQSQAGLESTGIENALIELLTDEQATVETDAIVDWEATGLPAAGGSVRVVMPQRTALGETASYWKHHPATGWVPFVEDPANRLFSAPGDPSAVGVCPAANDPAYRLGLNAGDLCVMLEIQDGGPNDADRLKADGSIAEDRGVNGHVIDPGTVVNEKPFSIPTNAARREHSVEAGLSGGSIGFGSLGVMLAAALFWRRRQHRG